MNNYKDAMKALEDGASEGEVVKRISNWMLEEANQMVIDEILANEYAYLKDK